MKRKILLSPLIIIIFIIIVGIGIAGASILLGGTGDSNSQGINLQKGLIAWWKMDGDAQDSTSYANDGTVTGATLTTDRKGQVNKAYSFNGTSDYIEMASPVGGSLDITGAITVAAWVKKSNNPTNNRGIVDRWWNYTGHTLSRSYDLLELSGSTPQFVVSPDGTGGSTGATGTTVMQTDVWYFLVGTFYPSSYVRIYVNGVLERETTASVPSAIFSSAEPVRVGVTFDPTVTTRYFGGIIDDVRIYNRALSATEITALYQSYNPGIVVSDLQKGLVGNWKMDGDANDHTSYANDGTVTGATLTTDRKGQTNKAYNFVAASSHKIVVANNAALSLPNKLTVSAWVYSTSDTWHYYFGKGYNAAGLLSLGAHSNCTSDGTSWWFVRYATSSLCWGTPTLLLNQWVHLVVTYDSSLASANFKTYQNGVAQQTANYTGSAMDNALALWIGASSGDARYWNGYIDDVRVWNRPLSPTEVTSLYESYNPGIVVSDLQKGLVGQWKMDGDANDSTSYQNDGTVTGATLTIDRKGQTNKAYSFNGTSDYIETADIDSLDGVSAITAGAWVNPISLTGNVAIVAKYDYQTQNSFAMQQNPAGKIQVFIGATLTDPGSNRAVTDNVVLTAGAWSHVMFVLDGSGSTNADRLKIYVNGVTVPITFTGTIPATTTSDNTATVKIGKFGGTLDRFWSGLIDDVRIYNRALSAAEVLALYESY